MQPANDVSADTASRAAIFGHPLHPVAVAFPLAFLVGALICDIAFAASMEVFWANAAKWLILAALVMGAVAAVLGFIDLLGIPHARALSIGWLHMAGNVLAMVLSLFNLLYRWADPIGRVVPVGLTTSVIVVIVLGVTGWLGGEMVFRHKIGVMKSRVS